jgi:hypothetical protein
MYNDVCYKLRDVAVAEIVRAYHSDATNLAICSPASNLQALPAAHSCGSSTSPADTLTCKRALMLPRFQRLPPRAVVQVISQEVILPNTLSRCMQQQRSNA